MTSSSEDSGAVEALLRTLIARGFRFLHPRDASGELLAVVGVRAHHNVVDVVWLHGEDAAHAVRMPADEANVLDPHTVLWRTRGAAHGVLDDLVSLDDHVPGVTAHQVGAATGCWVPVRPGRSRWLAATA
ncbi:hypothetical protein [Gandjariella thermophila]|uniref:Uncharacterized protein n=1 Tax=Gandjariella thermophila TaxID=1931992 RepID=A0A4D4JC12_9PSEU|nr:hypothetical protein [Gandjariella thermophila]GDY32882.1 hypothetical protein GTS_45150 [Gandjariella thermophila]